MLKIFLEQQYDYLNSLERFRSLFVWVNKQNKNLTVNGNQKPQYINKMDNKYV